VKIGDNRNEHQSTTREQQEAFESDGQCKDLKQHERAVKHGNFGVFNAQSPG
jgi:hypothetical protein